MSAATISCLERSPVLLGAAAADLSADDVIVTS
jgi:hypothetical protein